MRLLIFFCLLGGTTVLADYCQISSDHTMCRFGDVSGHMCGRYSEGGLSTSEIQEILKTHNDFRANVANGNEYRGSSGPQPSAANMQALVWDENLAKVAQKWADQCIFQHDICRDDPRFAVGQNIYWTSRASKANWTRAVESWYNEVSHMNPADISKYNFNYNNGHYAQLVWANSRYIGCGSRSYGGSYRIHGTKAQEHILSEARESDPKDPKPDYPSGERLDMSAGARGAMNTKGQNLTVDLVGSVAREEEPEDDYEDIDPMMFRNDIVKAWEVLSNNASLREQFIKAKHRLAKKMRIQRSITKGIKFDYGPTYLYQSDQFGPMNADIYENAKILDVINDLSNDDLSESLDKGGNENDENPKAHIVFPETLKGKLRTSAGWQIQNYDLNKDYILICNYGPSGNFIDEPIYEIGKPCSKCPSGTSCQNGLCG